MTAIGVVNEVDEISSTPQPLANESLNRTPSQAWPSNGARLSPQTALPQIINQAGGDRHDCADSTRRIFID
jgi:hypothetical protein